MKIQHLVFMFFISVNINAQNISEAINSHFEKLTSKGELLLGDVQWELSSNHISDVSGINHIYYYQTVNGYQILNTLSSIHLLSDGKVLKENTNFIKECADKIKGKPSPSISGIDAIKIIASQFGYVIRDPLKEISKEIGIPQKSLISNGGFSKYDIPTKLVYVKDENDELILSWEVSILENNFEHWWDVYVNSNTGKIIRKKDNVFTCASERNKTSSNENNCYPSNLKINNNVNVLNCENCYEVIPMPLESPYYGERSIVINPINYNASPIGWHDNGHTIDNEYTVTKGNNINSYIGTADDFEYQPNGGSELDFTNYLFDEDFTKDSRYKNASITNLFYWGNIIHDVLYQYGFNEVSGNFQLNNFNKGGAENDFVTILGQENLNHCNAQIGISRDGIIPFISFNACGDKDGAFDNIVIVHEYIHGLTYRLTGGANSNDCLGSEGELLTEGWADWYALMMTMSPSDLSTKPRGFATYLFNQGENGYGVRAYPYTTDMDINPQTYDYIKTHPGSHEVGSVWAAILWELTWVLIEEYGFDENIYNFSGNINQDAGNIISLAIATESMKLLPCNPGFVDGRNAILNAFRIIYGTENECLDLILWEAFAKRGLGANAYQGNPASVYDNWEDYSTPSRTAELNFLLNNVCLNANLITELSGGLPYGGVYSGLGILDDGNGTTFTFDPSVAGIGMHTVRYEVFDSACSDSSFDEGFIEVVVDAIAPVIACPEEDVIITLHSEQNQYTVEDFTSLVNVSDNCSFTGLTLSQTPIENTLLGVGNYIVNLEATDLAGNKSNCLFTLIIDKVFIGIDDIFDIYPNPTSYEITLLSNRELEALSTSIFDINGRLTQTRGFNNFGLERNLNIENLDSGVYFIEIQFENKSFIKQIIKN